MRRGAAPLAWRSRHLLGRFADVLAVAMIALGLFGTVLGLADRAWSEAATAFLLVLGGVFVVFGVRRRRRRDP